MKVTFDKYHGNGNDFIIVDGINNSFNRITQEKIKSLCDRNTGIGSDGFIIIKSNDNCDYEMVYYNSDGKIGSFCGNGARCAAHFALKNKILKGFIFSLFLIISCKKNNSQKPNIIYILADDLGYGDIKTFNANGKITGNRLSMPAGSGSPLSVIEEFEVPVDGTAITTSKGSVSIGNVTTQQTCSTSLVDLAGSSISYQPPDNTKIVIYSFNFAGFHHANDPIAYGFIYLDDVAVSGHPFTERAGYNIRRTTWSHAFRIEPSLSVNAATGRVQSWNSAKNGKPLSSSGDRKCRFFPNSVLVCHKNRVKMIYILRRPSRSHQKYGKLVF